jgi:aquaporin rerated protein, other eukaryote
MCAAGQLPWVRGAFLIPTQLLASMAASGVVLGIFPGPLSALTTLTNGTSITQGVFIEMFLTSQLVITVLMLAAEKTKATFIAPVGIGLALFIAELTGRDPSALFAFRSHQTPCSH